MEGHVKGYVIRKNETLPSKGYRRIHRKRPFGVRVFARNPKPKPETLNPNETEGRLWLGPGSTGPALIGGLEGFCEGGSSAAPITRESSRV